MLLIDRIEAEHLITYRQPHGSHDVADSAPIDAEIRGEDRVVGDLVGERVADAEDVIAERGGSALRHARRLARLTRTQLRTLISRRKLADDQERQGDQRDDGDKPPRGNEEPLDRM
ncbi:MAG TPA: hypothetical protein VGQ86_02890 [Candidatus Limnocylindria bacterium]|nr:hypothetical protein [Candidatus Limnocylindria bacterium]